MFVAIALRRLAYAICIANFILGTRSFHTNHSTQRDNSYEDASVSGFDLDERQVRAVCAATCTRYEKRAIEYSWVPIKTNTSIVAATVFVSVDAVAGTTSRSTRLVDLPNGYKLPPTNSLGTRVETLLVPVGTKSKLTTLSVYFEPFHLPLLTSCSYRTFPTAYVSWAPGYSWNGTLSTSGQCLTARTKVFEAHKSFPPEHTLNRIYHPQTEDPYGVLYYLTPVEGSTVGARAGDGARDCSTTRPTEPTWIAWTAKFITEEVTITGNSYRPPSAVATTPSMKTLDSTGPQTDSPILPTTSLASRTADNPGTSRTSTDSASDSLDTSVAIPTSGAARLKTILAILRVFQLAFRFRPW